jgi:hypothetical protein
VIVKKAQSTLASNKSFLYISQENNPCNPGKNAGTRGETFQTFVTSLAGNKSEGFRFNYAFFEHEDHFSVLLLQRFSFEITDLIFEFHSSSFAQSSTSYRSSKRHR